MFQSRGQEDGFEYVVGTGTKAYERVESRL